MKRLVRGTWLSVALLVLTFLITVLKAQTTWQSAQSQAATLTHNTAAGLACSPAPCVFPSVDASKDGFGPVSESTISVNPSNPAQILTGGIDLNCYSRIGFFGSSDGGSTWTHRCLGLGVHFWKGVGDPVTGYTTNNLALAAAVDESFAGLNLVVFSTSTDNGAHWRVPVTVIGGDAGNTAEQPWMEVDVHSHSPLRDNIYISSTFVAGTTSQIWVSHSTDSGQTWTSRAVDTPQVLPSVDQYSDLAVGDDGTVYLNWLRCSATGPVGDCGSTTASIMFSKSADGGNTWTTPSAIQPANLTPDPNRCCFFGALPVTDFNAASDIPSNTAFGAGSSTRLNVVYDNWTGTQMQVVSTSSMDAGNTWSVPIRVTNSATGDEFFPWIDVSRDGTLAVTWLGRVNDPANTKYQPFLSVSMNGGTAFGTPHTLTKTQSDPTTGSGLLGIYRTHVWNGRAVYATWPDTRRNNTQQKLAVGGAQF